MCAYGCVVPFWFIGAKHLAVRWHMSLQLADAYLLWPEGAIALIAPPFGFLIDHQKWSLERRLRVSAASTLLISLALVALAWLPLPPVVGVGLLGVGYACVQSLIWASVPLVSPPTLLNLSAGALATAAQRSIRAALRSLRPGSATRGTFAGFLGGCLNVLPMLLPAVAFSGNGSADLTVLAMVGAVGGGAYTAAALLERSKRRRAGRSWRSEGRGSSTDEQPVLPAPEVGSTPDRVATMCDMDDGLRSPHD